MVYRINYEKRVHFLFKLFTVADIGIIPSLHEEFGLVAIEMMMHKLPIIVNNTTGLSEIVRNRKNGLIARKNSSYDLAMKILELAGNKSLRISIGNEARKTYLSKYNSPLYTEKMFQVYESLIPHSLS
ncbi:glycosyltransferase [uncultured Alistipes sp.]|uniref:glycosyltransferase n=1 Tax=uncultured Alistipes sp. TaxID=538949 RepID=UPI002602FBAD|nr:glycosyltransferase [uncultured Alistipes sp.]